MSGRHLARDEETWAYDSNSLHCSTTPTSDRNQDLKMDGSTFNIILSCEEMEVKNDSAEETLNEIKSHSDRNDIILTRICKTTVINFKAESH